MSTAVAVKSRPIIFSAPMVRAILGGQKTMTRRVVTVPWKGASRTVPYEPYYVEDDGNLFAMDDGGDYFPMEEARNPYGSHLWVREALKKGTSTWCYSADGAPVALDRADHNVPAMVSWAHHKESDFCSPIHMPRWASRLTLEITEVRVERLQAITEEGAIAEGIEWPAKADPETPGAYYQWNRRSVPAPAGYSFRERFRFGWDVINGKRPGCAWADNPWVWVLAFRRIAEGV